MWKGSISFGLVSIPVKLYAATESKDVRFNLLHDQCRTPVQYRKWCASCDREVASEEIVKGYEYERGRYVMVTDEDFESIPVAAARTLDIVDFVKLEQIDPVFFEKTYYLEPGEGGAKAYALLRRAMEMTGRIAIARVVIRSKESLAAIRVFQNGVLALETMHFPDEVRSPAGLTGITEPELRQQEIEMATNLVASLSGDFTPEKFQNEYRQALLELIEAKATGEEVVQVAAAPERGRVVDLMEALRASIRAAEEGRGEVAGPMPDVAAGPAPDVAAGPAPGLAAPPAGAPPAPAPGFALPGLPVAPPGAAPGPVPGVPGFSPPGPAPGAPGFALPLPGLPVAPPGPAPGAPGF
ncbi:MAG TPA: Ku protein, partial [Symbiobacteriaceae bacterium]|nr:Ku protein [Symbiobacteriaceae bacterium]